jgi:hypothetical protein
MQTEPKTDTTPTDELAHELALVSDQVRALADPAGAVDTIVVALDRLYAQGADDQALADIQAGGERLLAITDASTQALRGAVELAQRLKQQRDQVEKTLSELKRAMENLDFGVPEIEQLFESVEEMMADEVWMYAIDSLWENIMDDIATNTGLTYSEADDLIDLLRFCSLNVDHPAWSELHAWMARTQRAQEQADA